MPPFNSLYDRHNVIKNRHSIKTALYYILMALGERAGTNAWTHTGHKLLQVKSMRKNTEICV